jgi:folate-binding protein YgfZ
MPSVRLDDRGVVEVSGPEARLFLDRLVTCDLDTIEVGGARYGALLTPQGKILADFVILATGTDAFLLDAPAASVADLVKRLQLYRLRAKVTATDLSAAHQVAAGWGDAQPPADAVAAAPDPRRPELGWRAVVRRNASPGDAADQGSYHAHRIACGVPEAGRDFLLGDAFPHEALMDQLGGVDFRKGCYVGQEVVSRMQHRGTARTRIVRLRYPGAGPHSAAEVVAGERALGRASDAPGAVGLGLIRLDRAGEALASGEPIRAGGQPVALDKPDWVRFAYPGEDAAAST